MLTVEHAAAVLGAPRAQLIRWALQGVGPAYTGHPLNPNGMRYEQAELERWKSAQKQTHGHQNRRKAEGPDQQGYAHG